MEPITRKEVYLAKLAREYNGEIPEPVSREELYLACLCQGDYRDDLPAPTVRKDHYPAFLLGINNHLPEPLTRAEYIWNAICDGSYPSDHENRNQMMKPITREEVYLLHIWEVYDNAPYDTRQYRADPFTITETDPFGDDPRNYGYSDLIVLSHRYSSINRAGISITIRFHASFPAGASGDSLVVLYAAEVNGIIPKARITTYTDAGDNLAFGVDTEGNIVVKAQDPGKAVNFSGHKTFSISYTMA